MFFSRCKELFFRTRANPKLEIEASANYVNCATVKAKKDLRRKNSFFPYRLLGKRTRRMGAAIFSAWVTCAVNSFSQ